MCAVGYTDGKHVFGRGTPQQTWVEGGWVVYMFLPTNFEQPYLELNHRSQVTQERY